ncbi:hypothetical protein NHG29_01435 [Aerococcaceae bacterium NML160702]|nr:hypothetical protein [Aerococcaceae bacterium NML190073]MCW6681528.1 hypothetical protein [Aerococcaceae bacterium NML160702]
MIWMVIGVVVLALSLCFLYVVRRFDAVESTIEAMKEEMKNEQTENRKEFHFCNWLINDKIKDVNSQLVKHKEWIKTTSDSLAECRERLTKLEAPTIRELQKKRKLKK